MMSSGLQLGFMLRTISAKRWFCCCRLCGYGCPRSTAKTRLPGPSEFPKYAPELLRIRTPLRSARRSTVLSTSNTQWVLGCVCTRYAVSCSYQLVKPLLRVSTVVAAACKTLQSG